VTLLHCDTIVQKADTEGDVEEGEWRAEFSRARCGEMGGCCLEIIPWRWIIRGAAACRRAPTQAVYLEVRHLTRVCDDQ